MPTKEDESSAPGSDSIMHIDADSEILSLLFQYRSEEDPSTICSDFYELLMNECLSGR